MIEFKPIGIDDKKLIDKYLSLVNYKNCDFAFASLFCWQTKYHTSFAEINDFLVIRYLCDDGLPCYMMPIGHGDFATVLRLIMADVKERNERFRIHAITSQMFDLLDRALPNTFIFKEHRDFFEYLYLTEDLALLKGKKYQAKRNHINRFKIECPDFKIQPIKSENIQQCLELYNLWADLHLIRYPEEDLIEEQISVLRALDNYDELGLKGILLYAVDRVVAFSYGESITFDTFAVHVEKALHDVHGAYAMINQQFAQQVASNYLYINREEDLGIESLRQAKLSYHPHALLQRGSVNLIDSK